MRKTNEIDKKNKSKFKFKKINFATIVGLCFICYFIYTFIDQQSQLEKYKSQIEMYNSEIKDKNKLTDYYGEKNINIQTDSYMENVAREKLGYIKPYEKVFIDANK